VSDSGRNERNARQHHSVKLYEEIPTSGIQKKQKANDNTNSQRSNKQNAAKRQHKQSTRNAYSEIPTTDGMSRTQQHRVKLDEEIPTDGMSETQQHRDKK